MVCLGYAGVAAVPAAAIPIDPMRTVRSPGIGGLALRGRVCDAPRLRVAFTLVELLTVIAIIAVLATLLLTALGSTQKRSRQARCTSNLHQVSLALQMYMDDFDRRPAQLPALARTRYLPSREMMLCPEDKTGNWGELSTTSIAPLLPTTPEGLGGTGATGPANLVADNDWMPYSYTHPLSWDDAAWNLLLKAGSLAGVASCQVHGLGRPNLPTPSVYDFEGLVLRAQRDGAIVRRKVFWTRATATTVAPSKNNDTTVNNAAAGSESNFFGTSYPWPLFTDEPSP